LKAGRLIITTGNIPVFTAFQNEADDVAIKLPHHAQDGVTFGSWWQRQSPCGRFFSGKACVAFIL
jgi:hypothetical protein